MSAKNGLLAKIRKIAVVARIVSLALAMPVQAQAADNPMSVAQLLSDAEATYARLGATVDLTLQEELLIGGSAQQLTDSRTSQPYATTQGHPLPYYVFDGAAAGEKRRTVLFIGGIHADELDPQYSAWHLLADFLTGQSSPAPGVRVIYAPLTNPDGLISMTRARGNPSRANFRGVDLNRNFNHGTPEQETRFLMELISRFSPDTIVSLHAPYDWLDYDGPAKIGGADPALIQAVRDWQLAIQNAALVHLPIIDNFEIYPGSLGEYAGFGLKINVMTFEYPSMDIGRGAGDWKNLGPALLRSLTPP